MRVVKTPSDGLIRFSVRFILNGAGRVQHIIRAADPNSILPMLGNAYPGREISILSIEDTSAEIDAEPPADLCAAE